MSSWSNLASEAREHSKHPGPKCQVRTLIDSLPAEDAGHLVYALRAGHITNPALHRALAARVDETVLPSQWALGNHRRGNCACDPKAGRR